MTEINDPGSILVYDIETAGVNALNADLGYIITFGYITLEDFQKGKKFTTISIGDFPRFKKDPHDDIEVVKAALKIMNKAKVIIHHYGNRFDEPYIRTRAMYHGLESLANIPALDTCYLAYKKLKLSSNRLVNVARFLRCKYQKIDKKDGWPTWWMHYLKGSLKYDKEMRTYCGYDVMTLAEISLHMRPYWPPAVVHALNPKKIVDEGKCRNCGSAKHTKRGQRISLGKLKQRALCSGCGSWFMYTITE